MFAQSVVSISAIHAEVKEFWPQIDRVLDIPWAGHAQNRHKRNAAVMAAVLYVLVNDLSWTSIPQNYPSARTCQRCCSDWVDSGALQTVASIVNAEAEVAGSMARRGLRSPLA